MLTNREAKRETDLSRLVLQFFQNLRFFVFPAFLFLCAGSARTNASEPLPDGLDQIARAFRIEIITANAAFPVQTTFGMIEGKNADETDLEDYTKLFSFEFAIYPPELVQRAQLKRVVFCTGLSFAGQRRNAVPDFEHDTLYLDVSRGKHSQLYLRKVIHHEFFHIIDYRDDGAVYRDDSWSSLNAADFQYGTGGAAAQDRANTSILTTQFPGFLNHYSTTGVEEDKAEVFANLIVGLPAFEERASKDHVLNAKMERMKQLLTGFCPELNEMFWERVRSLKRTDQKNDLDHGGH